MRRENKIGNKRENACPVGRAFLFLCKDSTGDTGKKVASLYHMQQKVLLSGIIFSGQSPVTLGIPDYTRHS